MASYPGPGDKPISRTVIRGSGVSRPAAPGIPRNGSKPVGGINSRPKKPTARKKRVAAAIGRLRRNPNNVAKIRRALNMSAVIQEADWRVANGSKVIDLATLTAAKRKALKKSSFAVPKGKGSKPNKDSYPVNDLAHAKNALARVAQSGTPAEKRMVIAAVRRKFPALAKRSKAVKSSGKAA
jgi:hypothetical protein